MVAKTFDGIDLFRIKASSDNPNQKQVTFFYTPEVDEYDHLIFACPVHGFMVCRVMKAYLDQIADLSHKTIDCFVTHMFGVSWLGGSQALKQMKKVIELKHGTLRYQTSINWTSKKREKVIGAMIEKYMIEED